jgi:uncharacterized protein (DUF58 family)
VLHVVHEGASLMATHSNLLAADDHDRLASLTWYARGVVEGLHVGMHRSPYTGVSVEFKEHRPYVRGDEVRSIDWKLYGKTDRLYIRQYEHESNLTATLLVDQSGSMSFQGTRGKSVSKHHFAIRLAACLSYLFVSQHDAVGLGLFDTEVRTTLPPRNRVSQLQHLIQALAESKCGGETRLSKSLTEMAGRVGRRGVVFLISDGFDDTASFLQSLSLLRQLAGEVVFFQVWHPDELDFPFSTRTRFLSLEVPGLERILDPLSFRKAYKRNLERFQQEIAEGCSQRRITHVPCRCDESHADLLARVLSRREVG